MIKLNDKLVEFEEFPNKETRIKTDSVEVTGKREEIYFKFENDSDLIKLLLLKNYLDDLTVATKVLTLSYMPYSRQDRVEGKSPFTLKYISNFINSMNFDKVKVVEPHSDVTPALLNNVISYNINFELLPLVFDDIAFDCENDYIVFPDATAAKRYGKVQVKNQLLGVKERDFETGRIKNLELFGNVNKKGFNALLVDDVCSYGGTFLMTAEKLKEMGANNIYLLVAHCENSIFDGDIFKSEAIKKVFTTNSIISNEFYWNNKKHKEKLKIFDVENYLKE